MTSAPALICPVWIAIGLARPAPSRPVMEKLTLPPAVALIRGIGVTVLFSSSARTISTAIGAVGLAPTLPEASTSSVLVRISPAMGVPASTSPRVVDDRLTERVVDRSGERDLGACRVGSAFSISTTATRNRGRCRN